MIHKHHIYLHFYHLSRFLYDTLYCLLGECQDVRIYELFPDT